MKIPLFLTVEVPVINYEDSDYRHRSNANFVFCRKANSKPESEKNNQDFTQSHLSAKEITWSVQNLNSLPKDAGYTLDSPPFVFQDATWCLRLYPNWSLRNFVGLTIVRLSSRVPHHKLVCLMMSSRNHEFFFSQVAEFSEVREGDMSFIPRSGTSSPGDGIEVLCQLSCFGSHAVDDASSQTEISAQDTKDVGAWCRNLGNPQLNGQNCDVVLKVGDKEFRAHQRVLRAGSPVLDSMLSHEAFERNGGVVFVPDCDPSAFRQFLIYLYSGRADALDPSNMLSMYRVAEQYDSGSLKGVCREFVKESLSVENVTDVVRAASDHGDQDLSSFAEDYFSREFGKILRTGEWLSFMECDPARANELVVRAIKDAIDALSARALATQKSVCYDKL